MESNFNQQVSGFYSVTDPQPKTTTLGNWFLKDYPCLNQKVEQIRNEADKDRRDQLKKSLPAVTPSGLFAGRRIADNLILIKHSGVICLDFDHLTDVSEAKERISRLPFILFLSLSVSGNGLFALVPILFPEKHKAHFAALQQNFQQIGFGIDPVCSDVTRLRFYSHDPEPYIRERPEVYTRTVEQLPVPVPHTHYPSTTSPEIELILNAVEKTSTDITSNYRDWLSIGFALAFNYGETGRNYFHRISRFHPEYNQREADRQYNACLRNRKPCSLNMIFHIMKKNNVFIKEFA